ncbi:hypothetical protein BLNAU_10924 [Blattamonas nauphoetae]|uniref:Uncharacterized protein n=1 Tax=Blattamonas nauphoetae TaxID=2049346 RepID=A0ABQ9XRF0_9EUKA|nr:hypothetical protein BLNAU_10924 [Blattamonas nauphoetae]
MNVDRNSTIPQVDNGKAKQTNFIEVCFDQISGDNETLRPIMLNTLLALAAESGWALSTILGVEYIKPLEEYCEKTQPCDVPLAIIALFTQNNRNAATRSFLQLFKVPSAPTDTSSELVPFAGWLCRRLAEYVTKMKSLFPESSPSDGTISTLSTTLPSESPLLNGNTILIDNDCVPLLKSTIIIFLDLLKQQKSDSISVLTFGANLLEENLVERVMDTSKPMTVPTTHGDFHLFLIWAISHLIWVPTGITKDREEQKRIRKLQFDRVLTPAKHYLQYILQREEFIPKTVSRDQDLPHQITFLLSQTFILERDLFEVGEIVETGREEWEVGWLVEKTEENELGEKLTKIREGDVRIKKDEKARLKKRVERQREAGHEDALEGWLTRRDNETGYALLEIIEIVSGESEMNVRY